MAFPATYNISYYRGDQYDFIVNPKNPDGSAFDLTGYTSLFIIASERGDATKFVGYGSASANASTDSITCKISPTFGNQLTGSSYVYDLEITKTSSSTVYTILTGALSVNQDVRKTGES